ncbi:MAG: hypothetical protein ACLPYS_15340 [Vulcanimicrobiaceae bacterium]
MIQAALTLAVVLGASAVAQVAPDAGQSPSPEATAVSSPAPQPTQPYRFIYRTPQNPNDPAVASAPAIVEIDLTDQVILTPTELNVRVLTSPSVISVTVEALGHTIALPLVQPGLFGFSTTLRGAPSSLRNRTFDVQFVAADAVGRTAAVTLPLTLR